MYLTRVVLYRDFYPTDQYYPFNIPAFRGTDELVFRAPVSFFVGENGSGKSTLLEAITRKCGIHVWDKPKRHVVHDNPYEEHLCDFVGVSWANGNMTGSLFRAETFYEFADFLDDGKGSSATSAADTSATASICSTSPSPPCRRRARLPSYSSCNA
jgi:predicted ATPase